MRSAYGISPETIAFAFRKLSLTKGVQLEDPDNMEQALVLYESGIYFADALHLASCRDAAERFATFEKRFQKKAASFKGLPKVVEP